MTASKKKRSSKPSGTLMGMRSGFRNLTSGGPKKKTTKPTTFQQVFYIVAVIAVAVALFYAFSKR